MDNGTHSYVRQEEKFGCAIAVIAMILNKSYSEVKSMLPTDRGYGDKNGMTDHDYISFMFTHGYVGMTVHAWEAHTQIKRANNEWVKPIAPINIVSVITENGPHALLWIDNKIYDPNKQGVFNINEYNVQGITGFWNLIEPVSEHDLILDWLEWIDKRTDLTPHQKDYVHFGMIQARRAIKKENEKQIEELKAFKDYVHKRLDDAGVPIDPESPHKEAGCRIGGRLDIVLRDRDEFLNYHQTR